MTEISFPTLCCFGINFIVGFFAGGGYLLNRLKRSGYDFRYDPTIKQYRLKQEEYQWWTDEN